MKTTDCRQLNKKRIVIVALGLVFMLSAMLVSGVLAKYVKDTVYDSEINADKFYFTVDLLGDTHTVEDINRTIPIYGGMDQEIIFNVQNFFDNARVNAHDIKYNVSIELTKTQGSSLSIGYFKRNGAAVSNGDTYTMDANGKVSDKFVLNIPAGYSHGDKVTVLISASEPYTKAIELTFALATYPSDIAFYVKDHGLYSELIILSNIDVAANKIKIDWTAINAYDNLMQVDTTNSVILDDDLELTGPNDPETQGGYLSTAVITQKMRTLESISIFYFKKNIDTVYEMPVTPAQKNADGTYTIILQGKEETP